MGQIFTAAERRVMVSAIPKADSPTWKTISERRPSVSRKTGANGTLRYLGDE
jgi:hypothetical protein